MWVLKERNSPCAESKCYIVMPFSMPFIFLTDSLASNGDERIDCFAIYHLLLFLLLLLSRIPFPLGGVLSGWCYLFLEMSLPSI